MSNEDYAKGYNDGFRAGLEAGKGLNSLPYPSSPNTGPCFPWTGDKLNKPIGRTCQVCGMFFESGKAYGYCCANHNCPSKVTCSWTGDVIYNNTPNTNWSSWMSGRPTTKIT